MERKIIQIVCRQDTEHTQGYLTALCDDGTIWFYSSGKWHPLQEQIPQRDTFNPSTTDMEKGNE